MQWGCLEAFINEIRIVMRIKWNHSNRQQLFESFIVPESKGI